MTYTVLMSVYAEDSPEFLAEALKSIYEDQTRKPDQVVVVFDGPLWKAQTDVLNAFRDGKEDIVTFVELKRGMGLGSAYAYWQSFSVHGNTAYDNQMGDYVQSFN